jgi:hypothetical protein
MVKIEYIKQLEKMGEDAEVEVFTPSDEDHSVILLSETATRELCLALDEYLNHVDSRDTEQQEAIDHLYNDILDRFKFKRGSYILSAGHIRNIPAQFLKSYTPEDESVWKKVRDALNEIETTQNQ